jgi:hypothetical protein
MPFCVTIVQECPSYPQDKLARDDDSSKAAWKITHPNSLKKFISLNSPLRGGDVHY